MTIRKLQTRYRVLVNRSTDRICSAYLDDDGFPVRFDETKSVTYLDDEFFVFHTETNRQRMEDLIAGKEIERDPRHEILHDLFDSDLLVGVLPRVRKN